MTCILSLRYILRVVKLKRGKLCTSSRLTGTPCLRPSKFATSKSKATWCSPTRLLPRHWERLREETAQLPTQTSSYHDLQGSSTVPPQWQGRGLGELIANPTVAAYLERVLGPDIIFFNGSYRYYEPGAVGVVLHTDGYPYGASVGGYDWTAPVSVRVSYYLECCDLAIRFMS